MAKIAVPSVIKEILRVFLENGHSAYVVGGCVRDGIMGRTPNDWDVAVSCPPEVTMALFPGTCIPTGIKHGTVTIKADGASVEATTFRIDGTYSDSRHPDSVLFSDRIEDDLSRRDFTVNAMAADVDGEVLDPFGGRADIDKRLLRAVGEPLMRFQEDSLRIFRAFRFSAQLGFEVEENTYNAICGYAPIAPLPSAERIRDELDKLLLSDCVRQMSSLFSLGLMREFCGGSTEIDFSVLALVPPERDLRLGALCALLEAGKIAATEDFLKRLRYDGHRVKKCTQAVFCSQELKLNDSGAWRHLIADTNHEIAACAAAASYALGNVRAFDLLKRAEAEGGCLAMSQLAIGGGELISLGMKGVDIGKTLDMLLHHVVDFPNDNRAERLLELTRNKMASN